MGSRWHPEEERICQRCGRRWYAERWTNSDAHAPLIGAGFSARAQDLHRQSVHNTRSQSHLHWAQCQGCGSRRVSSANKRVSSGKPYRTYEPVKETETIAYKKAAAAAKKAAAAARREEMLRAQTRWVFVPAPAGWHPDPARCHQLRWWDGSRWTAHVATNGVTGLDPL